MTTMSNEWINVTDRLVTKMPDKKLTDAEIVKALECCASNVSFENCAYCHYKEDWAKGITCLKKLIKDSLDLINHQKSEIERLYQIGGALLNGGGELLKEAEKAKAEAIKECLEWVLSLFPEDKTFTTISRFIIKQKLKEMVGED